MLIYFIAFIASFVMIWLKAMQQLNVVKDKRLYIMPISMCMALCEVSIIGLVVSQSFWLFIPIGLGGGCGCLLAMSNHKKIK